MKEFLKLVGQYLSSYPTIQLNTNDKNLIHKSVLKHLNIENMGQLRDMYEGQAFLDKTMMRVGALIAINKYYNLPNINFDKLTLGDFQPQIILNNVCFDINVFDFGTLPSIDSSKINNPIFFVIKKDSVTFSLCGSTTSEIIIENLMESNSGKSEMKFYGFKYLTIFNMKSAN